MSIHVPFTTITLNTVISAMTGGGVFGLIVRQIGPWRKQTIDANAAFIKTLSETIESQGKRIDQLEKLMLAKDRQHFIEIRRIEARSGAQQSLDRHKFGNREAVMDSLLRVIELSPDKAKEAAGLARQDLARWREAEQLEAAEIHKAEMAAVQAAERELDKAEKTIADSSIVTE